MNAAWNLHTLTQKHDLAAFILFSSIAATIGNPGQANYAAANAYLDALAEHRHAHGLPATSIAWGLWEATSTMTTGLSTTDHARLTRTGITALPTQHALALLDTALHTKHPTLIATTWNTTTLTQHATTGTLPALLTELVPAPTRTTARPAAWGDRLAGQPAEEQRRLMLELVRGQIAEVLAHSTPDAIDSDRGLFELGFDSLTALDLRNRLSGSTGLRLPSTLVFDYPTSAALADHLRSELVVTGAAGTPAAPAALAELDRLEAAIVTMPADRDVRTRVADRLREVLRLLDPAEVPVGNGAGVPAGFAAATDDEIFDFLDNHTTPPA